MMSVSVDDDKGEWEKAVKEDGLGWIQMCVGSHSKINAGFRDYFTLPIY